MTRTYQTGGDIDTVCTRCKLNLTHIVVAMDASRVVRVKCKTCGSEHNYRHTAATPKRTATASGIKKPKARTRANDPAAQYDRAVQGIDLSKAKRYRASNFFAENEVIHHLTFGLGLVVRELSDKKIEVTFPIGTKVLAHDRQS